MIVTSGPGLIVCGPGPTREVSRRPAGDLWCFRCRKRLAHDWVVAAELEPSYYEPNVRRECAQCHQDHTFFPGREGYYDHD